MSKEIFEQIYSLLDEYFEMSFPAFTAGLSLFSVIASMYLAIKELIK